MGYIYKINNLDKIPASVNRGEIVCLMPNDSDTLKKMTNAVNEWRERGFSQHESLTHLFDFLKAHLSVTQFQRLVFGLPHPILMDYSAWGKLILKLIEGGATFFSSEIFTAEIAKMLHFFEVFNATNPVQANVLSSNMSRNILFEGKARTAGNDDHVRAAAGAAATLIRLEEQSGEAALEALRNGDTLPISGMGNWGNSYMPFALAAATEPIKGLAFSKGLAYVLYNRIIDIQKPAELALKAGLFGQRKKIHGWVFSSDGQSVQVYPK